ncbi:hypothetical protein L226DRAFT_617172 [Lentinus tigrinus ALCF2SS1-7]|uniref:Uncharacterized protein n=1 Tax=Lentinus tigrinus ALCF2SS1-6 TaxID=1328759 RepID=A0A5C2S4Y5_9APHY|nr:hypothetical protein L227DRAFT_176344 [Lentinus tigrinus ALCF2SS1-6]RPD68914.1 hypothetical protein L226DRAFT_617172 [Lentinus tigrinus ALCF2SS1-7]
MHEFDPLDNIPGGDHTHRHVSEAGVFATQPVSAPPFYTPPPQDTSYSTGPLFAMAMDLRPALDEVAFTSRKRKRGAGRTHPRHAPDETYSGMHRDPAHYVVHADVPALSLDVSASMLKLATSMYPLHAKVAKENAEHFQTHGLRHLRGLIAWSDYPLHLYVHCEQISPVPTLYVRRISEYSQEPDEDSDMDVNDGLPVAHLHIGSGEDPSDSEHMLHYETRSWSRFTFIAYGGEMRKAKVMTTRLNSTPTCNDYDILCNPSTVGTSDDPSPSVVYLPRGYDCTSGQLHLNCCEGLCKENTPIVLGGWIPRSQSDAANTSMTAPPRKRQRRSVSSAWEGR